MVLPEQQEFPIRRYQINKEVVGPICVIYILVEFALGKLAEGRIDLSFDHWRARKV